MESARERDLSFVKTRFRRAFAQACQLEKTLERHPPVSQLDSSENCQGCHIVDTKTDRGYIGPTLTHVGSRLTAAWIYQWMKNPQALRPGTIEPSRAMSDEDARALTTFLISQKGGTKEEGGKK
jgi:cytochrome c1